MRKGLLLFFLCPLFLYGQKASIQGQITDSETGEELFAVNVVQAGTTNGTTTDFAGKYKLEVDPGTVTIQFSYLGYEAQEITLELTAGQTETRDIIFAKASKIIEGVTVSSEGKFKKDLSETTVSMEVVKESFITNNATTTADETLNKIPGFQVLGEGASIRGGSGYSNGAASRVMFLVDGLPMFSPDNGRVLWESMPAENIEQIEVIKGASSALYGSSALNGVVNFQTVDPTNTPQTKLILNFGFYNQPNNKNISRNWTRETSDGKQFLQLRKFGNGSFSHSRRFKTLDVAFAANYKQDAGYTETADIKRIRMNGKLKWRPQNAPRLNVGMSANFMHESGGFFFFWNGLDTAQYEPYQDAYTTQYKRTITLDPFVNFYDKKDNRHSLKTRFYNQEISNTDDNEYTNSNMYFADYTFLKRYSDRDFTITSGATTYFTNARTITFGNHKSGNIGAYAQFEKKWANVFTLNAGIRLEYYQVDSLRTDHDMKFWNWALNRDSTNRISIPVKPIIRAGINWQITEGTNLRASFGQGYRFPTAAELFVQISSSGTYVYPNPDLISETGWSSEIGIKQGVKLGTWLGYFDLSGFVSQYRNMIEFRGGLWGEPSDPVGGFGFRSINITNARISGFEISTFSQGEIFKIPFQYLIGYTYTYPINLDHDPSDPTSEKYLPYRNFHNFKADVQITPFKGLDLGAAALYIGYLEVIDPVYEGIIPGLSEFRAANTKGFWVFDLRLGYIFSDHFRANFIIKNIGNKLYTLRPAFLEAPRNMTFSVQYQF